jgi:hypothetical protein
MNTSGKKRSLSAGLLLALLSHLITLALRHAPALLGICLWLSLAYVAFLAIHTASLIRHPWEILDFDLLLCRWSWLFILGPITAFLTTAYTMEARGLNPNVLIFGYDTGWLVFQLLMEAGLIFSVAVLFSPPTLTISRPRLLWKILAFPMSLAHGFYVVGSLTRGFGQAL